MEKLKEKSAIKISNVTTEFKRYLVNDINLNSRLISIRGARGTGKTTLLLQLAKERSLEEVLYVALDDLFFTQNNLYDLAEKFHKLDGKLLLLDEVHKYPSWSRELKLIYDDFSDLNVIFTSSSILDIYKGESDLSRRASSYILKEMSFREYLSFKENIHLPVFSLEEIIVNHSDISLDLTKSFKPIKYFKKFIKIGNYPYYNGNENEYYQAILNTVNLILDVDMQGITTVDYNNIAKFKRLLYIISMQVPFTPNIKKLSEKLQINRNSLVQALQLLDKAELITTLIKSSKSISFLSKPDKIWLHNTNLSYAISSNEPNIGSIRETFFLQHLIHNYKISLPDKGDFFVDRKYTFEIGGQNKTNKQIKNISESYLVKDDIEIGVYNQIPLWLIGLTY